MFNLKNLQMNQKEIDELYAKSLGYDTFNYNDKRSRNEKEKYNVIDLWEKTLEEKTKKYQDNLYE